jgi:hypothetical protein
MTKRLFVFLICLLGVYLPQVAPNNSQRETFYASWKLLERFFPTKRVCGGTRAMLGLYAAMGMQLKPLSQLGGDSRGGAGSKKRGASNHRTDPLTLFHNLLVALSDGVYCDQRVNSRGFLDHDAAAMWGCDLWWLYTVVRDELLRSTPVTSFCGRDLAMIDFLGLLSAMVERFVELYPSQGLDHPVLAVSDVSLSARAIEKILARPFISLRYADKQGGSDGPGVQDQEFFCMRDSVELSNSWHAKEFESYWNKLFKQICLEILGLSSTDEFKGAVAAAQFVQGGDCGVGLKSMYTSKKALEVLAGKDNQVGEGYDLVKARDALKVKQESLVRLRKELIGDLDGAGVERVRSKISEEEKAASELREKIKKLRRDHRIKQLREAAQVRRDDLLEIALREDQKEFNQFLHAKEESERKQLDELAELCDSLEKEAGVAVGDGDVGLLGKLEKDILGLCRKRVASTRWRAGLGEENSDEERLKAFEAVWQGLHRAVAEWSKDSSLYEDARADHFEQKENLLQQLQEVDAEIESVEQVNSRGGYSTAKKYEKELEKFTQKRDRLSKQLALCDRCLSDLARVVRLARKLEGIDDEELKEKGEHVLQLGRSGVSLATSFEQVDLLQLRTVLKRYFQLNKLLKGQSGKVVQAAYRERKGLQLLDEIDKSLETVREDYEGNRSRQERECGKLADVIADKKRADGTGFVTEQAVIKLEGELAVAREQLQKTVRNFEDCENDLLSRRRSVVFKMGGIKGQNYSSQRSEFPEEESGFGSEQVSEGGVVELGDSDFIVAAKIVGLIREIFANYMAYQLAVAGGLQVPTPQEFNRASKVLTTISFSVVAILHATGGSTSLESMYSLLQIMATGHYGAGRPIKIWCAQLSPYECYHPRKGRRGRYQFANGVADWNNLFERLFRQIEQYPGRPSARKLALGFMWEVARSFNVVHSNCDKPSFQEIPVLMGGQLGVCCDTTVPRVSYNNHWLRPDKSNIAVRTQLMGGESGWSGDCAEPYELAESIFGWGQSRYSKFEELIRDSAEIKRLGSLWSNCTKYGAVPTDGELQSGSFPLVGGLMRLPRAGASQDTCSIL